MYLSEYTGRGVRVAIVDSGVHAAHPHVGGVAGGVAIHEDGTFDEDYVDWLGHGTAVAAVIREKAPDADVLVIKVFWRTLATDVTTLVRGIEHAAARGATVINLSLGTAETVHRERLEAAVATARTQGAVVVAAIEDAGVRWLPGGLDDVVAVCSDWTCARDAYRLQSVNDRPVVAASPYPRDIPGVPRERNVKGISFAVANASGFVARALEAQPAAGLADLFGLLEAAVPGRHPA